MAIKLLIARSVAMGLECPDIANWVGYTILSTFGDSRFTDGGQVDFFHTDVSRIHCARNMAVEAAFEQGSTHLLFVDPDMAPDYHIHGPFKDPDAEPFLSTSLQMMEENGPCVIAAPACSGPPEFKVNVYVPREDGRLRRVTREEAAGKAPSIEQIGAIGTGLMLIDMKVIREMPPPYFQDVYRDPKQTNVHRTQDTQFCIQATEAGFKVYANWYAWAGHWKKMCVGKPASDGLPLGIERKFQ